MGLTFNQWLKEGLKQARSQKEAIEKSYEYWSMVNVE